MKRLIQSLRVLSICAAFAISGAALAAHTDSDDSADASATPSPSPSHRHHSRVHHEASPTPGHAARNSDEDGPDATPSSSPAHKKLEKNVHPSSDDDSDVSPTPKPATKKHWTPAPDADDTSASPAPQEAPENVHARNAGTDDNGDMFASPTPTPKGRGAIAADASIDPAQITEYSRQPAKVQALISSALALTSQNLTYTYGSDDPANGGMDCSGFIYYVLTQSGMKDVPRDASEQYSWVRKAGNFRAVVSRKLDGFEMDELKPGDLLFWTGTYQVDRDPPVTHTMIYLGREKSTGKRVMAGSSDGRSYHGEQRWGVSVFDFKESPPPPPGTGRSASLFIGYGAIPGLTGAGVESAEQAGDKDGN